METSGTQRILVVEDNLDHAATTVELLRDMGHDAVSALSGFAALAHARSFRPHIVLLDIGLPDRNGWELARLLRREHGDLRIIAVTGRSQQEDRAHSIDAGCEAHLVKPVDPRVLESMLCLPHKPT